MLAGLAAGRARRAEEPGYKWWVLLTVGIGTLMSALDGSVVNTVLPLVARFFGRPVGVVEWVAMAYLLTVSALLLTFGRLGDLLGHKHTYNLGFVVFALGSFLSGISPGVGFLIGFRVLQAFGAAMLMAASPAILTLAFPATERGRALGMQATLTYIGLTLGPTLGGYVAGVLGWRWVFFINVPIGVFGTILAWAILHEDPVRVRERFDPLGAGLFSLGLGLFLYYLSQGESLGYGSGRGLLLLAASLLSGFAFLWQEGRFPHPMIDFRLFRDRAFSLGALNAFLNYVVVFILNFLIPFYLIVIRDLPVARAGLLLGAMPLVMAVSAPLSGTASDRVGTRLPAALGMGILTVAFWLLGSLGSRTPLPVLVGLLALAGLGTGVFISPNNSAVLGASPPHRRGVAAGVVATARNVGMVVGIAIGGLFYGTRSAGLPGGGLASFHAAFHLAMVLAAMGIFLSLARQSETPA